LHDLLGNVDSSEGDEGCVRLFPFGDEVVDWVKARILLELNLPIKAIVGSSDSGPHVLSQIISWGSNGKRESDRRNVLARPQSVLAVLAMELANNSVSSQLTMPYYAISPYQFGKKPLPNPAVKYRLWPCQYTPSIGFPLPNGTLRDYLTTDMRNRIAQADYCFDWQIQFQKDVCLHPINDFLTEWKETDTPFITFGRINIPKQVMADNNDYTCRHVAFNMWRVLEDHRALGSLSRARLFDMMNSHNHRLSLDNVQEPFTRRRHPGYQFWTPDELGMNDAFKPATLKGGYAGNLFTDPNVPNPPCPATTCPPAGNNSATAFGFSAILLLLSLVFLY